MLDYEAFIETINFAYQLIYAGFYTMATNYVYSDDGINVSILDLLIGFLAIYLIVDRILYWTQDTD